MNFELRHSDAVQLIVKIGEKEYKSDYYIPGHSEAIFNTDLGLLMEMGFDVTLHQVKFED